MFKNRIEYWIKSRGLVSKYVAKQCGVTEQTVSNWKKNRSHPDLEQSFILAKLFDINIGDLGEYEE